MNKEKVSSQSMDVEEVELNKLKTLFPQCFAEGKLDTEKLLSLVGKYAVKDHERYNFEWKGKADCYRLAALRSQATLRPCPAESVNFDTTKNLYIEGDNLEVLKTLQKAYYGRVKMIYIDPPYNTGNDFVYEDDFKDPLAKYKELTEQATKSNPETAGRFHTNWLNMMFPRLRLAYNLLRDDGVIFISIDDNEVDNLKKLCNEVFGEENFIVAFPRVTKKGGKSSDVTARNHDYVLMYAKSIGNADLQGVAHNDDGYSNKDEYFEERGFYKLNQTLDYDSLGYVQSLDYPIEINGETFYAGGNKETYEQRQKGVHGRADWGWRWSRGLFLFGLENGFIEVKRGGNRPRIYTKTYQNATIEQVGNEYKVVRIDRTKPLSTLEFTDNTYSNDNATKCISELIGKGVFEYTKHPALIKKLASLVNGKDFTVLDFFSGSATTAHAVMELNAEDGGNRRFICVQLPELCDEKSEAYKAGYKNICEIGKERIRRAGKKILEEYKNKLPLDRKEPLDVGFKVFKLDTSNLVAWDATPTTNERELYNRMDALADTIKKDRTDLDVVYEVMLKLCVPLDAPIEKLTVNSKDVYSVGAEHELLVCLNYDAKTLTQQDIEHLCQTYAPGKIVAAEAAFADDAALANAYFTLKNREVVIKLI